MKELEKTRRLSIAAVLSILVLLIALLSYKRPEHLFTKTTDEALSYISNTSIFLEKEEISTNKYIVDIRNNSDFERGHLNTATNIYGPEFFNKKNKASFDALFATDKEIVLVGGNTDETIPIFMTLYRMGIENVKLGKVKQYFENNEFIVQNEPLEKEEQNVREFIKTSIKKAAIKKVKPKPIASKPKKVIPKKKKKKMPIEGGC